MSALLVLSRLVVVVPELMQQPQRPWGLLVSQSLGPQPFAPVVQASLHLLELGHNLALESAELCHDCQSRSQAWRLVLQRSTRLQAPGRTRQKLQSLGNLGVGPR